MAVKFNLRSDMPVGFKEKSRHPELSEYISYLSYFKGRVFNSPEEFQAQVLDNALKYLQAKKIPQGPDSRLREGLKIEKLSQRVVSHGNVYDYRVFSPADNIPRRCVFGGLENID